MGGGGEHDNLLDGHSEVVGVEKKLRRHMRGTLASVDCMSAMRNWHTRPASYALMHPVHAFGLPTVPPGTGRPAYGAPRYV